MTISSLTKHKKIGIICWGLMGDVLLRTPVISALRIIFPNSEITCIVDNIGKEVLKNNNDIDHIIVFDRSKKNIWQFLYNKIVGYFEIKKIKFDLMIDLYSSRSSSQLLILSNAPYRMGFTHSKLQKNTYTIFLENEFSKASNIHISKSLLKITTPFGYDFESFDTKPIFITQEATNKKIKKYLETFQLNKTYLLNLGSGGLEKILSLDKSFTQVEFLYNEYGYQPLIICNPGQESIQKEFIDKYLIKYKIPYGAMKVLDLEEIGSAMKLTNFIITPDTGLYHIAVAVSIPILGIFTYTDPELVKPGSGIYLNCFQAKEETINNELRVGKKDIDTSYLIQCLKEFIQMLDNKNNK